MGSSSDAEVLLRESGLTYTIVRPGWFGGSGLQPILQQGDTQEYGPVANAVVADALINALTSDAAISKTFELFSEDGVPAFDWNAGFAALATD